MRCIVLSLFIATLPVSAFASENTQFCEPDNLLKAVGWDVESAELQKRSQYERRTIIHEDGKRFLNQDTLAFSSGAKYCVQAEHKIQK